MPYYIGDPKRDPNLENYPNGNAGYLVSSLPSFRTLLAGSFGFVTKKVSVSGELGARRRLRV